MPHDLHPAAPVAPIDPTRTELHGVSWVDEYAWMADHDDPRLIAHLGAERRHYDSATEHLAHLSQTLFDDMQRRLQPTDESVRCKRGGFFYYTRTVTGSEYVQFMSSRDQVGAGRVLLDEAEFADITVAGGAIGGEPSADSFVEIGVREVSPDGTLLAYAVDTAGDEVYTLRFRRIDGPDPVDLEETIGRCYYTGAWSADSTTFFYTVPDRAYRPDQVWRHRIGTPATEDVLIFTESDARYEVTVRATRSGAYILIESACRDTTETWLIPAAAPQTPPTRVRAREKGVEYRLDHGGDEFLIVTNLDAPEYRLMRAPDSDLTRWTQLAPAGAGERLHACHALAGHLVLELRRAGFPLLRVIDRATGAQREIHAELPAGRLLLHQEFEYASTSVLIRVDSLIEPPRWDEVELATGARVRRKTQRVPGYDPADYRTERRHATAPDGTAVPVTLAWRADTPLDGTAPALLWGYGAYESCDDPAFDEVLPSLLDRGVVYALTHPRGGGEMGRHWWLDGRLASKPHTFADHLAVANWLADQSLVDGARIATRGLSAGGLLQAVVLALAPGRWRAVVAEVPFVDVVTSMLDPEIPLTVNEWDEWGDPRDPEAFTVLRGYSPYENLPEAGRRPATLVTGALHDPRVMVHEPAKWVARLRASAAATDGPLLFRVELGAGAHTGPSGRYAHLRYEAEVCAFILDRLGLAAPH